MDSNVQREILYSAGRQGQDLPSLVLQYAQSTDHLKSMKDALRSGERWARTLQVMRGNGYAAWLRAIIQAVKICSGCQRG